MKRILTPIAALLAGALCLTGSATAKTFTMKIGFVTINDSNHLLANWQQKYLEKHSNGRIKVKVYPAAQLGKIPRQIEGVQLGTQEAFHIPPGFFLGINKGLMVVDTPGLFDNIHHQSLAVNHPSVRDHFRTLAQKAGVIGNVLWSAGDTSVATVKPFKTLADMKGRKIRVLATPLERAVMGAMGATGVPMPYSEVLPAMQRNVVDGVRSGIIVMYPSKFYTAAKYVTLTQQAQILCWQALSIAWLKTLPDDLKKLIVKAGKESTVHAARWGNDMTRQAEKDWEKVGKVYRLPAADQKKLRELVKPIGDQILGSDPKTKPTYELMKKAAAATRGMELEAGLKKFLN
ncbi:MAG: TRAP transporter substrate-binding protein [Pseudomonadota bacterium]|nr:TRAP transporter substrate-binding protein [Pseudomonadota bacterium]